MTARTYGPAARWFAWRPVITVDDGVVWLRPVWRRRVFINLGTGPASMQVWTYATANPEGNK